MLFPQVSDVDLFGLIRRSMEQILLLVDVAEAPTECECENDNAARESAPNSATLGKEGTVAEFSELHKLMVV